MATIKYTCTQCGEVYTSSESYPHVVNSDDGKQEYICTECNTADSFDQISIISPTNDMWTEEDNDDDDNDDEDKFNWDDY